MVQRVLRAEVRVAGKVVGGCGKGLCVFVAAHKLDGAEHARKMADKVFGLRIFNDEQGKMNFALKDLLAAPAVEQAGGAVPEVLAISNFTLYGETSKNRRPSFVDAAPYEVGEQLYEVFITELGDRAVRVERGVFGADMKVLVENDGPVTVILDV